MYGWVRTTGTLAAAVAIALAATPATALVVRMPDGSRAPGCGLVHAGSQAGGIRLARTAERFPTEHDYPSPGGGFRVHYARTGVDAVAGTDSDGDGVPNWVEMVAHIADSALAVYGALGYGVPIRDGILGGGPEYDIYLKNLATQHVYGYTWPGPGGYLEIENDYAETNVYDATGVIALRVTVAHELFHAIQFSYWDGSDAIWWQEASATFMEDILYPNINDYWQYLNADWFSNTFFEDPSVSLDNVSGAHPYGVAVFCHFLNESDPAHGMAAIRETFVRQDTQNSGDVSVVTGAIEDVMSARMEDILATFWTWAYFSGSPSKAGRARPGLFLHDAAGYPQPPPSGDNVTADRWVVTNISTAGRQTGTPTVGHLGAWITRFTPEKKPGGIRIAVAGTGGGASKWAWRVAVATKETVTIYEPVNGTFDIGWENAEDVVLVGANGSLTGLTYRYTWTADYDATITGPQPQPLVITLDQNRPNPFNPSTKIVFSLNEAAAVTVTVHDALGRRVRTLVGDEAFQAGEHEVVWDGRDSRGISVASGIYIMRVAAEGASRSRAMSLIR